MEIPRVFRDYSALVIATGFHLDRLREMLAPLGFDRVQTTDQDKQAHFRIKQDKPNLVVVTRNLPVFSGIQLLVACRSEEEPPLTPFLIIGDKADLKPGGLASKVAAEKSALLIAEPVTAESMAAAAVQVLLPTVDRNRELAYQRKDEAEAAVKKEDPAQAEKSFRASLEHYENDLDCWLGLAKALTQQKKNEEAEAAYFKALELDNASLKAFLGLAELYEQQNASDMAVDVLRQAMAIAQTMEASGQAKAKIHFYIGEFELRLERLGAAHKAFSAAVEEDPENAKLRTAIGDAYAEHGHYKEAEGHYEAALALDPDLAHTYNRLGMAYRRQGKYERALDLYRKARLRHPEDEHLLFNIARTNHEMGLVAEALALLNEALTLNPAFAPAARFREMILAQARSVKLDTD